MRWSGSCTRISARCDKQIPPHIARCLKSDTHIGFLTNTWQCLMRVAELGSRRVAVWGLGREGRAAIGFLRRHHPALPLVLLDEAADVRILDEHQDNLTRAFGTTQIAGVLQDIDVIVKSPGVSLYRAEIQAARSRGAKITSLLNLWFAEKPELVTIGVTGTKGKSTTASLIAHILRRLGRRVDLAGNIGVPITEVANVDYAVIEVSSYQAADFDGICDIAVLTSLYPEHTNWHLTHEQYVRDKLNLLSHSRCRIVNRAAAEAISQFSPWPKYFFNDMSGIHCRGVEMFDGGNSIAPLRNAYLARSQNKSNLCAALAVAKILDLDLATALDATHDFPGLPHRQQELGQSGDLLFVDDSISTIPESTIAALDVYAGRDITVIVGGYDRGIDYRKLADVLANGAAKAVICLGASGKRIFAQTLAALRERSDIGCAIREVSSMDEAVSYAKLITPPGGVVLLSPAAPSYGYYRDYIERGREFAANAGLPTC
jgi:UDP-N-acetylmuramoyl-L-alanine---L-glutamate ligase